MCLSSIIINTEQNLIQEAAKLRILPVRELQETRGGCRAFNKQINLMKVINNIEIIQIKQNSESLCITK